MSTLTCALHRHRSIKRLNVRVVLIMAFIAATCPALAETIVIQNDGATSSTPGSIQTGFAAGDIAAAIFELPPGVPALKINTVQALVMSNPGDGVPTMFDVQLYCGAPESGPPVAVVEGAAMAPHWLNLLDVSGDEWIVLSGSPFAIGLRYNWGIEGIDAFNGHIVADGDGCQPGKNLVYDATAGAWVDPCTLGAPGDFIIRVAGEVIPSKAPFGDFNGDGSVDMVDFAALQRCLHPPVGMPSPPECADPFDCDRNGVVDLPDVMQFVACARGPAVPLDADCGHCFPAGLCGSGSPAAGPRKPAGRIETLVWSWHSVPALTPLALIDGGWAVVRGCTSEILMKHNVGQWRSYAQAPNSTERQYIKAAADHLRDVWGAADAEARQCGLDLGASAWYTTFCFVI